MTALVVAYGPMLAVTVAATVGLRMWVTWLDDRDAIKSFVIAHVPFTSDVAATERDLPEMRNR